MSYRYKSIRSLLSFVTKINNLNDKYGGLIFTLSMSLDGKFYFLPVGTFVQIKDCRNDIEQLDIDDGTRDFLITQTCLYSIRTLCSFWKIIYHVLLSIFLSFLSS